MNATTNELFSALIDAEQAESELEGLNTILSYLISEMENGSGAASADNVKGAALCGRMETFCKMFYSISTGISMQLGILDKSINSCYACAKKMRGEENG